MRALVPRRPSAGLKEQIFTARRAPVTGDALDLTEPASPATRHPYLAWLAPATAALLLVAMLVNNQRNPSLSIAHSASPLVAMALSNQNAAAWLPGSFSRERNGLPEETLEWTNGSGSTSSISSLSGPRGTN